MTVPARPVFIFVDGSNIFYPARDLCGDLEGPIAQRGLRIQWDHLHDLARARRQVQKAVFCASLPPDASLARRVVDAGFEVEIFERGLDSRSEQAVDQSLQVHMLRAMIDHEPGVAVLVTGDGAGGAEGVGFFADLKRMKSFGWRIEVLSWQSACNRRLKEWAQQEGVFVPLDPHYRSVTFVEHMRSSVPIAHKGLVRKVHQVDVGLNKRDEFRARALTAAQGPFDRTQEGRWAHDVGARSRIWHRTAL